jgi:HK97 family phage portal protein
MLLSTVYRCVDLISDSVAVLPLKTYKLDREGFKAEFKQHPAYSLLDLEPNEDMTRFVFFKTLMASVLLTGNGYAYIERDNKLNVSQLLYIPTSHVSIVWITDGTVFMRKR